MSIPSVPKSQTQCVLISPEAFWSSVSILLKKPHVVNKRLWGSKILLEDVFESNGDNISCAKLEHTNNIHQYIEELRGNSNSPKCAITAKKQTYSKEATLLELLPKAYNEAHAFQLAVITREKPSVTFHDVTPVEVHHNLTPVFPYTFRLENHSIVLELNHVTPDSSAKSVTWLQEVVLPQVIKWAEESSHRVTNKICNESLALVSHDKYYEKYNELKEKYGKEMVKVWPECTDPSKFVYEDVAIVTYLLLLWEEERSHLGVTAPQSFVDLGCGNGLLVYMLTREGHPGVGIDVRKRQIWDAFVSDDIKLEEKTITPSDKHLFPETDWIIGNHSDELTPWIPVIAARSSYACNFFLLPCCAFNFDGTKYQRKDSSKSQYTEYLEYIRKLCETCGFQTDTDRLKIPSTKRICLIGRGRTYSENEHSTVCDKIQDVIGVNVKDEDSATTWIKDFKARDPIERVKNCTQLDKKLVNHIVETISKHLLEDCSPELRWYAGKSVELGELVQLIPEDKLRALKSECGGLQTLLKNHHHIFKVQSGKVQLRFPKTVEEVNSGQQRHKKNKTDLKLQQRPCWFYNHHPQGCPLQDTLCSYLHVKS